MITVLHRPAVARLGLAGLVSEIGDWMLFIALPLFVLQLTDSPLVTATVFILELLPTILAGPLAGVLVDRWDPWRLMAGVALLQAVGLLPLLFVGSPDTLWLIYSVVVVESVLGTVIEPCRTATAATLVPAGELMAVNQLMGILSAVARLVGGPIGGVILGFYGIRAVLIADAATFLLAAVLLGIGLRRRPAAADRQVVAAPGRLLHEWAEGFRIVASSRILRRAMGVVGCTAAAQGAFVVLFVLFVLRDLDGTEADVGVLRGVQAIGAIVGGLLMTPLIKRLAPDRLVAVAALAFGVVSLAIWNAPTLTGGFGVYVRCSSSQGCPGSP